MSETLLTDLETIARYYDLYLADPSRMEVHVLYGDAKRDATNPPYLCMDDAARDLAVKHGWYITAEELISRGPASFASLDGTVVTKTATGYLNPYGPTGFTGPGVLGFGHDGNGAPTPESRAVDVVIQFIDPADGKLKFIGGFRRDTGQPCFVGGFQEKDAYETAVREFIEESISGSIDLKQCAPRLRQLCQIRKANEVFSEDEKIYLKSLSINPATFTGDEGEAAYHLIATQDSAFVKALADYFKTKLHAAYKGPSRADPRNTDQRWIATTMLTGLIDFADIQTLMENRPFPYRFAAGSDLTHVKPHEFGPGFVLHAFASHGPMACLATAHNLRETGNIPDTVNRQCREVIAAVATRLEQALPPFSAKPETTNALPCPQL